MGRGSAGPSVCSRPVAACWHSGYVLGAWICASVQPINFALRRFTTWAVARTIGSLIQYLRFCLCCPGGSRSRLCVVPTTYRGCQ